MTYSLFGHWYWGGDSKGWCDSKGDPVSGSGVYEADINSADQVLIDNPGGSFDDKSIRTMQQNVDKDTNVYLDGTGHDAGEFVELKWDSKGDDVDTVTVDASHFEGDFCLSVHSIQTIDKLYMSNVVSFTGLDEHGNPITPVYSANNVFGGGETGDQNGGEFGDGSYELKETDGGSNPDYYEITYIDRNGETKTIQMNVHVDYGDTTNISIDYICFARGTLIEVEGGFKRVEELTPGDMVMTKDSGYQPLQWIASRKLGRADLARNPKIRPITIKAGALGENLPEADLTVSPQHRMLVKDWRCEALFGETEMLAPAKALVNDHTVTVDHAAEEVEYFHFMFEQHEIVYANGVESESFHPGDFGLSTLDQATLEELFQIFPHLEQDVDAFGAPARPVLRTFEAQAMMSA
ncbi:Hint domain-containing protein [Psychromarinibacter sp. C21-152]|uniref:Hint domain-containing protein n=1 Tax=Psychromarinibacter sediminicola TaxID=3033385 RepID=A0AAE3NUH7_9RHOB|nr:Hint domain-containing protein [Psychromarinibacter sediminicola]MDF0600827.1 Hint domain-containing protein [Psychromarinibacter sediminicola]